MILSCNISLPALRSRLKLHEGVNVSMLTRNFRCTTTTRGHLSNINVARYATLSDREVRVRYAPSPTGLIHLGGLRTALYNYLFARRHKGTFILRVEDTDQTRFVPGSIENLVRVMEWAQLPFDEGPGKAAAHGPYLQSQRLPLYREHAQQLLDKKAAYRCFCSVDRLQKLKDDVFQRGAAMKYDRRCLELSEVEVRSRVCANEPHTIRLRVTPGKSVVRDLVQGEVQFEHENVDDQVLLKSDGYPTYHLANVVDDHLMEISHVIRGVEWLDSFPKHKLLYDAFEWTTPQFAHLPVLLSPTGGKLSKRQADVSVEYYIEKGYLPEALINFVALMGWSPRGAASDVFSVEEAIEKFDFADVSRSNPMFNVKKLEDIQHAHLKQLSTTDMPRLLSVMRPRLEAAFPSASFTDSFLARALLATNMRPDFLTAAAALFQEPNYEQTLKEKVWTQSGKETVASLVKALEEIEEVSSLDEANKLLSSVAAKRSAKLNEIFPPIRFALTGTSGGLSINILLHILPKETVLARLQSAQKR